MRQSWILLSSLILFCALWFSNGVSAAACCGGGAAFPSLIIGDEKAQLTASYALTDVAVASVDSNGVWRESSSRPQIQSFNLEGAHILADRWQVGFSAPVQHKSFAQQTYSGWGDVSGRIGYEYLPDWDYHPWRPKGVGFLQIRLPTGKSRAESDRGGLDSMGSGFWSLGLGSVLTKARGAFDFLATAEIHRSLAKRFSNSQMAGELRPGWGGTWGVGAGYSLQHVRFGALLTWVYEDPVEVRVFERFKGVAERQATASLSVSFLAGREWAGTLSYSDQTLIGSPVNTSLGRSLSVLLQRRWGR